MRLINPSTNTHTAVCFTDITVSEELRSVSEELRGIEAECDGKMRSTAMERLSAFPPFPQLLPSVPSCKVQRLRRSSSSSAVD